MKLAAKLSVYGAALALIVIELAIGDMTCASCANRGNGNIYLESDHG